MQVLGQKPLHSDTGLMGQRPRLSDGEQPVGLAVVKSQHVEPSLIGQKRRRNASHNI